MIFNGDRKCKNITFLQYSPFNFDRYGQVICSCLHQNFRNTLQVSLGLLSLLPPASYKMISKSYLDIPPTHPVTYRICNTSMAPYLLPDDINHEQVNDTTMKVYFVMRTVTTHGYIQSGDRFWCLSSLRKICW